MSNEFNFGTTQRAYTMRLCGAAKGDDSWRERLWITHERVNKGAKAFGDWLLTLRGGLAASAIDGGKAETLSARRRLLALCWFAVESEDTGTVNFRVQHQDDQGGQGGRRADPQAMERALRECLEVKGIGKAEWNSWVQDCSPALKARIRNDAVWVQRWKMFEQLESRPAPEEAFKIFSLILGKDFLAPAELEKKRGGKKSKGDNGEAKASGLEESAGDDEKKGSDPKSSKEENRARDAASRLEGEWFGSGKKTDFEELSQTFKKLARIAENLKKTRPQDASDLKSRILASRKAEGWLELKVVWKGKKTQKVLEAIKEPDFIRKGSRSDAKDNWERVLLAVRADDPNQKDLNISSEFLSEDFWKKLKEGALKKAEGKSKREVGQWGTWTEALKGQIQKEASVLYEPGSANTVFFRFMLGSAAARLAQRHSGIRRAEASREQAETDAQKKGNDFSSGNYATAAKWLDEYLEARSQRSGAFERMRIQKNAIDGWKEVAARWKDCKNREDRIEAVKELQESTEKFGDVSLFSALAEDDAQCVWRIDGKVNDSLLRDYVRWRQAEYDVRRYKVPRYCHPDALLHPVFCQFGNSKPAIKYAWQLKPAIVDRKEATAVKISLIDKDGNASFAPMRWQSERLLREFGFYEKTGEIINLSRNTRLGRLASGRALESEVKPEHPFSDQVKNWNARLEAPRGVLERIAGLEAKGRAKQAEALRQKIGWFLTFSPELERKGPFYDFIMKPHIRKTWENSQIKPIPMKKNRNKEWMVDWRSYYKFGWMVRPGLGFLPGIRVLGVDLGHRYGAIGAIWQQVSDEEIIEIAKKAGAKLPDKTDIAFRCDDPTRKPIENGKKKGALPQLVFRRLGEKSWARLERQFLIRLPGEIQDARPLAQWEHDWLGQLIKGFGKVFPNVEEEREFWKKRAKTVALARLEVLKMAARALRRQGDRAKIAHALVSCELPTMGGEKLQIVSAKDRLPHLIKAFGLWDSLANSNRWVDEGAAGLWRKHVISVAPDLDGKAPVFDEDSSPQAAKAARRKREALYPAVAQKLAEDKNASKEIADAFFNSWEKEEIQWKTRLRGLFQWIARGAVLDKDGKWVRQPLSQRNAGGLSLDRIAALDLLARLQRAFFQRPTKDRVFYEVKEGERPGHRVRQKMERLREDRLKKLANAIAMAAFGIVGKNSNGDRMARVEKSRHEGPRFEPVHAVVIESLKHYRPDASRTRRENRGLMSWSAGQMADRLKEQCDLHGLLMVEVTASYTSRFCSRCGAPGVRLDEVAVGDLQKKPYWSREWKKALAAKPEERTKFQRYLAGLDVKKDADKRIPIPREGGALFMCSNGECSIGPKSRGLQADLNAAANIGLRAMMDGRWEGAWVYLPTEGLAPAANATALKGAPEKIKSLKLYADRSGTQAKTNHRKKAASRENSVFNSFRDISKGVVLDQSEWKPYKQFWANTRDRISERLIDLYCPEKKPFQAKSV